MWRPVAQKEAPLCLTFRASEEVAGLLGHAGAMGG
jgi:hypothetical protein